MTINRRQFRTAHPRRGFSLIEVLFAILILGIGVISIASLFPAGIAQQQASVDDTIGPLVAENALALIRDKVDQSDFGTIEEFQPGYISPTIPGDWGWSRPAFFKRQTRLTALPGPSGPFTVEVEQGSICIFNANINFPSPNPWANTSWSEIPWNSVRDGPIGPASGNLPVIITQGERYYPMSSVESGDREIPQYTWDCMFRRFQGRIYVAIFVYRVSSPAGAAVEYRVPPQPQGGDPDVPRLPISLTLDPTDPSYDARFASHGMWSAGENLIDGTDGGETFNPDDERQAYQLVRQWILDQNNNIHRVLSTQRDDIGDPVEVELVRAVSPVQGSFINLSQRPRPSYSPYFYNGAVNPVDGFVYDNVVTNIWYLPRRIDLDANRNGRIDPMVDPAVTITPVYLAVREL